MSLLGPADGWRLYVTGYSTKSWQQQRGSRQPTDMSLLDAADGWRLYVTGYSIRRGQRQLVCARHRFIKAAAHAALGVSPKVSPVTSQLRLGGAVYDCTVSCIPRVDCSRERCLQEAFLMRQDCQCGKQRVWCGTQAE